MLNAILGRRTRRRSNVSLGLETLETRWCPSTLDTVPVGRPDVPEVRPDVVRPEVVVDSLDLTEPPWPDMAGVGDPLTPGGERAALNAYKPGEEQGAAVDYKALDVAISDFVPEVKPAEFIPEVKPGEDHAVGDPTGLRDGEIVPEVKPGELLPAVRPSDAVPEVRPSDSVPEVHPEQTDVSRP